MGGHPKWGKNKRGVLASSRRLQRSRIARVLQLNNIYHRLLTISIILYNYIIYLIYYSLFRFIWRANIPKHQSFFLNLVCSGVIDRLLGEAHPPNTTKPPTTKQVESGTKFILRCRVCILPFSQLLREDQVILFLRVFV